MANVPPLQRLKLFNTLPCPLHGHPGNISDISRAWIDFWNWIAPYITKETLPFELIDKICRETGIKFTWAFEKLSQIHKAVRDDDSRDTDVNSEDESKI